VLGEQYGPGVVRIQAISAEQNIPKRFLEQILFDLKSAGIVESRRGVAGGYRLAVAPDKIPLARVIRHLEGALAPVGCISQQFYEKCSCPDELKCPLRSIMKEVRDAIAGILEKTTVADLVARAAQLRAQPEGILDFEI
jgi:Rrf2 family protein